jgi:2-dehydropantoate 2-reductase
MISSSRWCGWCQAASVFRAFLVVVGSSSSHQQAAGALLLSSTMRITTTRALSSTTTSSTPSLNNDDDHDGAVTNHHPPPSPPQTIAVIGTGAVGGYYGARLHEAGHDVHFHMRDRVHYEAAIKHGLVVKSLIAGDCRVHPIMAYRSISDMAATTMTTPMDWIIVALKSTSLDAIPELVRPLLSPTTRILVIMNGLIEADLLAALSRHYADDGGGLDRHVRCIYGGMAFICVNRTGPAQIDHSYYGLLTAGVAYGRPNAKVDDETAFLDLFHHHHSSSKVPVAVESSLWRGRWKKMLWNLPFNGLSVAMGGITVDQIVQDVGLRQLARRIMEETVAVANASMLQQQQQQQTMMMIAPSATTTTTTEDDEQNNNNYYEPFGEADMVTMMKFSDEMGPYRPSTMCDFVHRRPMEVRYLFREPLNVAQRLHIATPTLEAIVLQIEAQQRLYQLF